MSDEHVKVGNPQADKPWFIAWKDGDGRRLAMPNQFATEQEATEFLVKIGEIDSMHAVRAE
jgi:hypothetical protein